MSSGTAGTRETDVTIAAPIEDVWRAWTTPEEITQWNAASDDRHTTKAAVDLRVGGTFFAHMEAKDGTMGFDFGGTYTKIVPQEHIEYSLGDGRVVSAEFVTGEGGVTVRETFDAEASHSPEQQRDGWMEGLPFPRFAAAPHDHKR